MFSPMVFMPGDVLSMPLLATTATVVTGTATCSYQLRTDGHEWATNGGNTVVDQGKFVNPVGNETNYECMSTVTSGTLTTDPSVGAWISLGGSTRTWDLSKTTGIGSLDVTMTVNIRRIGTTTTLLSVTVTLHAEKTGV